MPAAKSPRTKRSTKTKSTVRNDPEAALAPPEGASVKPAEPIVGASTVTETHGFEKVGSGGPVIGHNPTVGPLDRVRVDSTDRPLTTNQGVARETDPPRV